MFGVADAILANTGFLRTSNVRVPCFPAGGSFDRPNVGRKKVPWIITRGPFTRVPFGGIKKLGDIPSDLKNGKNGWEPNGEQTKDRKRRGTMTSEVTTENLM